MNKNGSSLAGSTIHVTMFPCNECSKLIIQGGIREVVYLEDKRSGGSTGSSTGPDPAYTASQTLLELAGVAVRQHRPFAEVRLCSRPGHQEALGAP